MIIRTTPVRDTVTMPKVKFLVILAVALATGFCFGFGTGLDFGLLR